MYLAKGGETSYFPTDLEQTVPLIHKNNVDSWMSGIDQSTMNLHRTDGKQNNFQSFYESGVHSGSLILMVTMAKRLPGFNGFFIPFKHDHGPMQTKISCTKIFSESRAKWT